jgi:hypothetical protein
MISCIFNNLKSIITHYVQKFNLLPFVSSPKGRPLKIKKADALTFALYQHTSTRATKKSVYEDFKNVLHCSYKTFVVSVNRAGLLALRILFLLMRRGKKEAHLMKMTDSTDIPVCLNKNAKRNRVMQGLARWGHSGKGFYYGLKLTMTRDLDGRILGVKFSPANASDRDLFRKINADIEGIILADAGYVSRKLETEMNVEGKRWCLFRPLKSMKRLACAWQLALYQQRWKIEVDFRNLKLFHGLVTSLPRSLTGMLSNYLFALLSFVVA